MGAVATLRRLLATRLDRDGQAPELEKRAQGDAPLLEPAEPGERGFPIPQDLIDRSLALKVMDGWLQNRHQVLVPLTFRLGRLDATDSDILMRFAAAVLANASRADEESVGSAERWLTQVGADPAALTMLRDAIRAPTPLSALLRLIQSRDLSSYAYAIAVAVADTRDAAGHLFASFIAARLALPADAIRSIDRRYRR